MYLAIEGVIGVGKTTLARLLQPSFEAELLLEVFEENPFLSDFYGDRARYAFQTQIFFLLSRYHQQRSAVPRMLTTGSLVSDYTFEKDALFARINLAGDELEMYRRVHEALAEKIPLPDLVVYLRASTDVLMQRIAQRDRPYERQMERDYIEELNHAYESYFSDHHHQTPVLVIDSNPLNFVTNPEDLKWVENRIRQALKLTPFQPELPLEPRD
jgi:deoxyguanosine kinase